MAASALKSSPATSRSSISGALSTAWAEPQWRLSASTRRDPRPGQTQGQQGQQFGVRCGSHPGRLARNNPVRTGHLNLPPIGGMRAQPRISLQPIRDSASIWSLLCVMTPDRPVMLQV